MDVAEPLTLSSDHRPDPDDHGVGYRYWRYRGDDLVGPYCYDQRAWAPGINRCACAEQHSLLNPWSDCGCGLYCIAAGAPNRRYVDVSRGTCEELDEGRGSAVVGAIAFWDPRGEVVPGKVVAARYAAIAALVLPIDATDGEREIIARYAERYRATVVDPAGDDLAGAVRDWTRRELDAPSSAGKAIRRRWWSRSRSGTSLA